MFKTNVSYVMIKVKKYKLDLFRLLKALDCRDFKFYSTLSEEEKKGFAGIVAMRWMSSAPYSNQDDCEYHISAVNLIANNHFWNPEIKNHTELQYLLLACCGTGSDKRPQRAPKWSKTKHEWIKGPSKKKDNKIIQMLKEYYPTANREELEMFFQINDIDDFINIAEILGYQDDQIKEIKTEIMRLK